MRVPIALLLVSAAAFVAVPSATACHPDPALPALKPIAGYYVVPATWYGGCPHELTLCPQVWRESNGEPGLQTTGANPDTLVVLVCPAP